MGGSLQPVFRPRVHGAHPVDDIQTLYLHLDEADKLARELGVTPLGDFISVGDERWHPIEDGLETIRALATAVRELPEDPRSWSHNIAHEFSSLEDSLAKGSAQAAEFRIVIA